MCKTTRPKRFLVAEKRGWRLFIKNTALCKLVRGSIGCDACPVLEATEPKLSRKASSEICVTVPQTDTGRRVESTKALERTQEKELGKLIP